MRGGMGGGVSAMRQAVGPGRLGDDEEILAKPFDNRVVMRLIRYGGPFKKMAVIAAVTMIFYTAALVAAPWLVAIGIEQIQDGDGGALNRTAIIFISVALGGWLAQYLHLRAMAIVTQGVLYILRTDLFRHLQRLSMRFYDRNEIGRVMSRVQNDVLNLQEFLSTAILGIADLLALGGILVAMFLMEPPPGRGDALRGARALHRHRDLAEPGAARLHPGAAGDRAGERRLAGKHLRRPRGPEPQPAGP